MVKVKELISDSEFITSNGFEKIEPEISIFLPTYKRAKNGLFEKCLKSILAQNFHNFELIIIDDASTDGTRDIIDRYMQQDCRISVIRHKKNLGLPAISEYEAYKVSRGQKVFFTFDDNEITRDGLNELFLDQKNNPEHKVTYGKVVCKSLKKDVILGHKDIFIRDLEDINVIGNGGILVDKVVFEKVGYYDPHIAALKFCDWDLWRRMILEYKFHRIDATVAIEWGLLQNDSLANLDGYNPALVNLWVQTNRNKDILIQNYEEYSIDTIPKALGQFFYVKLNDFCKNRFKGKFEIRFEDEYAEEGYILVVCHDLYASTQLVFEFGNNKYFFVKLKQFSENIIPYLYGARGVVFVRNIPSSSITEILKNLKMDYYYYTDDNLFLIKETHMSVEQKETQDFISNAKALIASSCELCQELKRYFSKDVYYLPCTKFPIFEQVVSNTSFQDKSIKNEIRIGWCSIDKEGGLIELKDSLVRYSKKSNIKFKILCVGKNINFKRLKRSFKYCKEIELVYQPLMLNYLDLLQKMKEYNPHFLIHTKGTIWLDIYKYKTFNFFITSYLVNAIPLIQKRPPFDSIEDKEIRDSFIFEDGNGLIELLEKYSVSIEKKFDSKIELIKNFIEKHYPLAHNYNIMDEIYKISERFNSINICNLSFKGLNHKKNLRNLLREAKATLEYYLNK